MGLERWLSGRKRTTRNRLKGNLPWVRIPPSPFQGSKRGFPRVSETRCPAVGLLLFGRPMASQQNPGQQEIVVVYLLVQNRGGGVTGALGSNRQGSSRSATAVSALPGLGRRWPAS